MRKAVVAAALLSACSPGQRASDKVDPRWFDPGWHFSPSPDRPAALFRVGDKSRTFFIGMCDLVPRFSLYNGDYGLNVESFTLTIDDRSWQRAAYRGEHGRGLTIDDAAFADVFAQAKRRIVFRTDDGWTREIRPSPLIARMVAECRASNKARADPTGALPKQAG